MTRLSTDELLAKIRRRENLTASEQTSLVIRLSVPAVLAEISTILMEYIDAAMVGHLGGAGVRGGERGDAHALALLGHGGRGLHGVFRAGGAPDRCR